MIIIGPGWYDYHGFTIITQPYSTVFNALSSGLHITLIW